MEPAPGRRPQEIDKGTLTNFGRTAAAREAGLSTHQQRTAMRVAAVPQDDFDDAVESEEPATVAQLAEMGKQSKPRPAVDLGGRDPAAQAA